MGARVVRALLLAASQAGCAADAVAPEGGTIGRSLPARFAIRGEALGGDAAGRVASCSIDLEVARTETRFRGADRTEYGVSYSGEVVRGVREQDGSGFGWFALVVQPDAAVRLMGEDSLELVLVVDSLEIQSPFWRGLALLAGSTRVGPLGTGVWQCQPLGDAGGYADTAPSVPGTWRIER